jgi:hypothetical protein
MTSRFDRVRPRLVDAELVQPMHQDVEGKRALFSTTEIFRPVTGPGIAIECSRCARETVLSLAAATRAMFPALHLSVGVTAGDRETTIGLLRRRRHGSWLRCPSCGRGSWVRVTVRL